MDWYIKCWKESFNFSGRARRKEYWMFFLINSLIGLLFSLAARFQPVVGVLYGLYGLALIPANLAVTFRRLHDTNHSGWNLFFAYVLPAIVILPLLFLMLCGVESEVQGMPIIIAGLVILWIVFMVLNLRLFYLMLKPSDIGPNQYGEDPIGDPDRKPGNALGCLVAGFGVAVLVIVILLALFLPALSAARKKAREVACRQNLKQIGLSLAMYAMDNDGFLPMELSAAEPEQLNVVSCPAGESNLPYQLLDSAKGLKLSDLENASEIPLMVCDNHRKTCNVLFADGHVETMSWDALSPEMRSPIIPVEESQE